MDEKIKQQLDEMTELINSATEAPVTETVATDAPATASPATDSPATDAPASTAPVTDAPEDADDSGPVDSPPEPPPSAEMAALKAELTELRALLKKPDEKEQPKLEPVELKDENF